VPHTITDSTELAELAQRLTSATALGLDTEFLRERTYRAELALLQIAWPQGAVCVDPLALPDLTALAGPLTAGAVKVMHASRQDIEVLYPVVGLIAPIFDTQIAAGLAGFPAQVGYGELVRRALNVNLAKSHTRTDWMRRPLSAGEIEYALDDVRYLLPLQEHLTAQLARLGRVAWLEEELSALVSAQTFAPDPERAWLRVKGLKGLDAPRARLARELAAWRERRAVERNRPRGWILDDMALREIVARVPRALEALSGIPELQAGMIKHCGEEIISMVAAAKIPDPPAPLTLYGKPDPAQQAKVKRLSGIVQKRGRELNLSPEILATRRDLEQLAEGRQDIPLLQGWRRAMIGQKLLSQL
jgi:ribonuclease D